VLGGTDREGALLDLALERVDEIAPGRRAAFAVLLGTCWVLRATADGDVDSALAAGWYVLEAARESGGWERRGGVVRAGMVVTLGRLGQAELWLGETDAAVDHLRLAHREALDAGMVAEQVASLGYLAVAQALRGRLSAARSDADTALARASAVKRLSSAVTAPASFASALVHYGRDEIGPTATALDSVARADIPRTDPLRVAGRILDARCRWAEGDAVGAMKAVQSARHDLTLTPHARALSTWLTETEAGMHLQLGDLSAARWTLRSAVLGDRPPAPVVVMSARLKLAEGEPAAAVHLLQGVVDRAVASDDLAQRLQVALVLVPALHAQGLTEEAGRVLQDLVAGAATENHRRLILDADDPARVLLAASRSWSDSTWPFLDELALATSDPSVSSSPQVPVHVEPLSERERDVLRYLPTMLTFAEIGSELYISVNTTKSHVRSIYRKLGVEGRRDAVRRARQFQLLRP
jgi:LuxR family maltose regulon positive regulatory protein